MDLRNKRQKGKGRIVKNRANEIISTQPKQQAEEKRRGFG